MSVTSKYVMMEYVRDGNGGAVTRNILEYEIGERGSR